MKIRFISKSKIKISMFIFVCLLVGCARSDVSIVIKNPDKGKITINRMSISDIIIRRSANTEGDSLYILNLKNGEYEFRLSRSDGMEFIRTAKIQGEAYFAVDLATGETDGFIEDKSR